MTKKTGYINKVMKIYSNWNGDNELLNSIQEHVRYQFQK